MGQGGCGYGITMPIGEAVGISGEGGVGGIRGGGKVRETGGSGMTIGEIFCLFLLQKLPILLAPLSFFPLHG